MNPNNNHMAWVLTQATKLKAGVWPGHQLNTFCINHLQDSKRCPVQPTEYRLHWVAAPVYLIIYLHNIAKILEYEVAHDVIIFLGRMVLIVNGAYRGTKAILESIDVEKFSVTVKLAEVRKRNH